MTITSATNRGLRSEWLRHRVQNRAIHPRQDRLDTDRYARADMTLSALGNDRSFVELPLD